VTLPTDFESWKAIPSLEPGFGFQWELLRPFFLSKGYALYVYRAAAGLTPHVDNDPAADSFGLHGTRTGFAPVPSLFSNVRHHLFTPRTNPSFEPYYSLLLREARFGAPVTRVYHSYITKVWLLIP
jgi:hypothetical protein